MCFYPLDHCSIHRWISIFFMVVEIKDDKWFVEIFLLLFSFSLFQTLLYYHLVESTSLSPGKVFSVAAIFQIMCYPFYFLCVIYTSCLSAKSSSKQLTSFLQSTQICQHPSAYFTKCPQMGSSPTEVRCTHGHTKTYRQGGTCKMQSCIHTTMNTRADVYKCRHTFKKYRQHTCMHKHGHMQIYRHTNLHAGIYLQVKIFKHTKLYAGTHYARTHV